MICAELAFGEAAQPGFDDIRCAAMLDKAILLLFQDQVKDAKKWAAVSLISPKRGNFTSAKLSMTEE